MLICIVQSEEILDIQLAINGTKDTQVNAEKNLEIFRRSVGVVIMSRFYLTFL
ncbi:MAG: hypothetical protein K2H60_10720 [Muribaculaceae bacterium]|nr:hypothetical protein [Muribaculaceae bacterium]